MPWIKPRSCFPLVLYLFPRKDQDWLKGQWHLSKHRNSPCAAHCVLLFPFLWLSPALPWFPHFYNFCFSSGRAPGPSSTAEGLLNPCLHLQRWWHRPNHLYWSVCWAVDLAWDSVFLWDKKPQPKAKQVILFHTNRRNCASWHIHRDH